jgi:hypothetical protein
MLLPMIIIKDALNGHIAKGDFVTFSDPGHYASQK